MNNQVNPNPPTNHQGLPQNQPRLSIDFSSLHNQELISFCQVRFQKKQQENVSQTYLRVLFTAVTHYDRYLEEMNLDDYSMWDKDSYQNYLEQLSDPQTGAGFSPKYIRFLTNSIGMLLNRTE